jgi:multidrug resistance efflux pump
MPTWLPGVLVALVGVIPAFLVFQQADTARKQATVQADRTARLDERKADREELQSALTFWKTSFDAVTKDNGELRKELATERRDAVRLRRRVERLEDALRRAGLSVPNGADPL